MPLLIFSTVFWIPQSDCSGQAVQI